MTDSRPVRVLGSLKRQLLRGGAASPSCFLGEVALGSGRFAVVSDLQRTSGMELWRESNRVERELIVRRIADEKPDFVAMLGDLVFQGSSLIDWREFDELTSPLRDAAVPVLPVLGNHEYWVFRRGALANFFARFPALGGKHWYSVSYGPLALVFLDSNLRFLSPAAWNEELDWYAAELARCDAAQDVAGVLVFLHHPPYTNSTVTTDELHVQQFFVPPFAAAKKTLAMLSGHVHSYERFCREGKMYVVTGGGGGPRAALAPAQRRRHEDDLFAGPSLRSFHYLVLTPSREQLEVEMLGLAKHGRTFERLDRFVLPFPSPEPGERP